MSLEIMGIKMQKLKNLGYKSLERPVSNRFVLGTNGKTGCDISRCE